MGMDDDAWEKDCIQRPMNTVSCNGRGDNVEMKKTVSMAAVNIAALSQEGSKGTIAKPREQHDGCPFEEQRLVIQFILLPRNC